MRSRRRSPTTAEATTEHGGSGRSRPLPPRDGAIAPGFARQEGPMAITISDAAAERVRTLKKKARPQTPSRVGVRGGGCSGLTYWLDLVDAPERRTRSLPSTIIRSPSRSTARNTSSSTGRNSTSRRRWSRQASCSAIPSRIAPAPAGIVHALSVDALHRLLNACAYAMLELP